MGRVKAVRATFGRNHLGKAKTKKQNWDGERESSQTLFEILVCSVL